MKLLVALALLFAAGSEARAEASPAKESAKATLDVEWENVEEAVGYEIRLTPKAGGKALQFQSVQNRLVQIVPVGTYGLQVRSKDKETGYYGPWSEASEIEVVAKSVSLVAPADRTEIEENKANRKSVTFQWAAVRGAKKYILRVWNDDPAKAQEFQTEKTQRVIGLPVARTYNWQVTFEDESGVRYAQDGAPFTFAIIGAHLETPVVDTNLPHPVVTKLAWSEPPKAKSYQVRLLARALDESEWKVVSDAKSLEEAMLAFPRLAPGAYRVEVTAKAPHRRPSETGVHEFLVKPSEEELQAAMKRAL